MLLEKYFLAEIQRQGVINHSAVEYKVEGLNAAFPIIESSHYSCTFRSEHSYRGSYKESNSHRDFSGGQVAVRHIGPHEEPKKAFSVSRWYIEKKIKSLYAHIKDLGWVDKEDAQRVSNFIEDHKDLVTTILKCIQQYPDHDKASLCVEALRHFTSILVFGAQYADALEWMYRIERYKDCFRDNQYKEFHKLQGKALDRIAHDVFYKFTDIRKDSPVPEKLSLLLKVCHDPGKIDLMEPIHRSEFLACVYWFAIEHRNYDVADSYMKYVDVKDLRRRLRSASTDEETQAHWVCLLGLVYAGFKIGTFPVETIMRMIELCVEDSRNIPEPLWKNDWKMQFCFYSAWANYLPVFLLTENTRDEEQVNALLSELDKPEVKSFYEETCAKGRYEHHKYRALVVLAEIRMSKDRFEEVPEIIEKIKSFNNYRQRDNPSVTWLEVGDETWRIKTYEKDKNRSVNNWKFKLIDCSNIGTSLRNVNC